MWTETSHPRIGAEGRSTSWQLEHGALVTLIARVCETNELVYAPLTGRRGVPAAESAEMPEYGPNGQLIYRCLVMKPFDLDTDVS